MSILALGYHNGDVYYVATTMRLHPQIDQQHQVFSMVVLLCKVLHLSTPILNTSPLEYSCKFPMCSMDGPNSNPFSAQQFSQLRSNVQGQLSVSNHKIKRDKAKLIRHLTMLQLPSIMKIPMTIKRPLATQCHVKVFRSDQCGNMWQISCQYGLLAPSLKSSMTMATSQSIWSLGSLDWPSQWPPTFIINY